MIPALVQEKLAALPQVSGVYLFKDKAGKVVYVGKAKSLRSRVRWYFQESTGDTRYFVPLLHRTSAQFVALSIAAMSAAQGPSWQSPPKLVVGIVVDQMCADYIYRYWNNFGTGGFKRMVSKGAFLRGAHFDHVPTETGPGHAVVYTGTVPSRNGIVANEMYVRTSNTTRYCASASDSVHGVGCDDIIGRRSPGEPARHHHRPLAAGRRMTRAITTLTETAQQVSAGGISRCGPRIRGRNGD